MGSLKELDTIATEIITLREAGLGNARRRRAEDQLVWKATTLLKPSIISMAKKKSLLAYEDEVMQHAMIAIHGCIGTGDADTDKSKRWNPEIATFSTHVHWQLRAELRTLELFIYPERRASCKDIDLQITSLDRTITANSESGELTYKDVIVDPSSEHETQTSASLHLLRTHIENTLGARMAAKVTAYERRGCSDPSQVLSAMRNLHIYFQREVENKHPEEVSVIHGVTRERIRQIVKNVAQDVSALLPNAKAMTEEMKRQWKLAAALYKEQSGIDIRLNAEEALEPSTTYERPLTSENAPQFDFPVIEAKEDAKPVIKKAAAKSQKKKVAKQAVTKPGEAAKARKSAKILPFNQKKRRKIMGGALAVVMATSAATQVAARPVSCEDACTKDAAGAFAIKLGSYKDKKDLRDAAKVARKNNEALADLRLAFVPDKANQNVSLAFAPFDWTEAEQVCSKIKSKGMPCSVVHLQRSPALH